MINENAKRFFEDLAQEHLVVENPYFAFYDTVNTTAWDANKTYNAFMVNKLENTVAFLKLEKSDFALLKKQVQDQQDFIDYATIEYQEYDLDLEK
ncbi:hypothetical protein [Ligilactobacillus ceti]|uniref:Uncharacterized protein n=1 Tax=Ligilactobacillus ceti DSM 22408 TaxID=1122146 RepID=A0A0R2KPG5_9LACO|nr:hypothetical protein [Ligilactobacillus ceti]KRN88828.1 hypothetical protein IV53_GL000798 [Ligilactobacillus ceti DSM 22408]